jgi:hypothetical protein
MFKGICVVFVCLGTIAASGGKVAKSPASQPATSPRAATKPVATTRPVSVSQFIKQMPKKIASAQSPPTTPGELAAANDWISGKYGDAIFQDEGVITNIAFPLVRPENRRSLDISFKPKPIKLWGIDCVINVYVCDENPSAKTLDALRSAGLGDRVKMRFSGGHPRSFQLSLHGSDAPRFFIDINALSGEFISLTPGDRPAR